MDTIHIPPDFREFLRLLNSHEARYLLVGGYAVCMHGYPRTTADMDIWVAATPQNASRVAAALREFGFAAASQCESLLATPKQILRMGVEPLMLEVFTSISGAEFERCFANRVAVDAGDLTINLISLEDLKANRIASGRDRDRDDLAHLP